MRQCQNDKRCTLELYLNALYYNNNIGTCAKAVHRIQKYLCV